MRLARLPPIDLIELHRASAWNRERFPLLTGVDPRHLHDLSDVVTGVAQRSCQGQRNGMRLSADRHGFFEIGGL